MNVRRAVSNSLLLTNQFKAGVEAVAQERGEALIVGVSVNQTSIDFTVGYNARKPTVQPVYATVPEILLDRFRIPEFVSDELVITDQFAYFIDNPELIAPGVDKYKTTLIEIGKHYAHLAVENRKAADRTHWVNNMNI